MGLGIAWLYEDRIRAELDSGDCSHCECARAANAGCDCTLSWPIRTSPARAPVAWLKSFAKGGFGIRPSGAIPTFRPMIDGPRWKPSYRQADGWPG
jgi:hypothetical protein